VQADFLNRSRLDWILSVPLTTNLTWANAPGNLRLSKQQTRLPRRSVANVSQVAPLHRAGFVERVAKLPINALSRLDAGLHLVLGLDEARP
jgi:mRNA interferase MazF